MSIVSVACESEEGMTIQGSELAGPATRLELGGSAGHISNPVETIDGGSRDLSYPILLLLWAFPPPHSSRPHDFPSVSLFKRDAGVVLVSMHD